MVKILHLITQRNQPYMSVRKCCEMCGKAIWDIEVYTDEEYYYDEKKAHKEGLKLCSE